MYLQMKEKIAAAASADDGNDDGSEDPIDVETVDPNPPRLEPLSRRSSKVSTKKAIQEEERLLSNIAAREEQSVTFQTKVLEMLAPSKATERTRYADWAKEVMVSLHPSLWLKFQRECTNLLYTYQEKNEELLNPVSEQQQHYIAQQPHYTSPNPQQYQMYPRATSGTSSTSAMWQPQPHQWPTTVQPNMSVWGSQNSAWVQEQMTELHPMTPAARGPTAAVSTRPAASATQSTEPLSLSNIIRDTIGIPNTSLESEVTPQNE